MEVTKGIILFSTGCPKCKVLKQRLAKEKIQFDENNDTEYMKKLGLESVPALMVSGKLLNFVDAIQWINQARAV